MFHSLAIVLSVFNHCWFTLYSERGEKDPDIERGRKLLMKVHAM